MQHLESLRVEVDKLRLGFDAEYLEYISWQTYLDSWKMVDEGETDVRNLPIYQAKKRYYASFPSQKLEEEAVILDLQSPNPNVIAEMWVKRHVELYHSIRKVGFKPKMRAKPITVRIAWDGSLEVTEGNNTVSILKYLKYQYPIQVKVSSRAQEWMKLKEDLNSFYGKKLLYQPTDHPDFDDWEVDRGCVDRWGIIKPALGDIKGKRILDIGCNGTWFSRELARCGASVTGVDPEPTVMNLARCLSRYHGFSRQNPNLITGTFEIVLVENEFDAALMLSVIHHYIRRNPQDAWNALNLISQRCKCLILELGLNKLPIEWKPEVVLEHTEYRGFKTLYNGERPIYLYNY